MHGQIAEPLIGGALIGLASSFMLLFNGRITGISGIYTGVLSPSQRSDFLWKTIFVIGLILGGFVMERSAFSAFEVVSTSTPMLIAAGLLVGIGTRVGSGCTSGHGICGLSRQSPRSFVNVMAFMIAGMITLLIMKQLGLYTVINSIQGAF